MGRKQYYVCCGRHYTCVLCDYSTQSETGAKLHMKKSLGEMKKIKEGGDALFCGVCKKRFCTSSH